MPSEGRVPPRRRSDDDLHPLSALSIAPRTFGAPSPEAIAQSARLLRECWERGVTTFDVVASGAPQIALTCLATAFPEPPDEMVLVVPLEQHSATTGPRDDRARPRPGSLEGAATRTADVTGAWGHDVRKIVELRPVGPSGPASQPSETDLKEARELPGFLDYASAYQASELPRPSRPSGGLVYGAFSLLERGPVADPDPWGAAGDPCFLARDVLASGRLDGSAWTGIGSSPMDLAPPRSVRDLATSYRPILELSFLTQSRQRTLAQAAIAYALAHPWVLTATVPLPPAHRLSEILGFDSAPALTQGEILRLDKPRSSLR